MLKSLLKKNEIVTIDISNTVGQESAIEANGSPIFLVKITAPARIIDEQNDVPGFGRVVDGPVAGFEVLYTIASEVIA